MTAHLPTEATSFELWCEAQGVHPDAPLAWESYTYVQAESLLSMRTSQRAS
jgi:hypothetical protein